MIRSAIVAAGLLSAATPATAMDLHSFLTKADALQKRGPLALLSSDYRVLKKEAENAGAELKSERLAIVKAGKPAPYCPPAKAAIASS